MGNMYIYIYTGVRQMLQEKRSKGECTLFFDEHQDLHTNVDKTNSHACDDESCLENAHPTVKPHIVR